MSILEQVQARLAKLRAPEDAEAKRRAEIAQLEQQREKLLKQEAAARKAEELAALVAEFEAVAPAWTKARQELIEGLRALFERYHKALPLSQKAERLQGRLRELGHGSPCLHPGPPRGRQFFKRVLSDRGLEFDAPFFKQ